MASETSIEKTGLYILLPIYGCCMVAAALWAHRQSVKLTHDGVETQITAHYLGGRSFGPFVTAATFFASFFSGYTVVGIPNDAFRDGFLGSWWLPSSVMIVMAVYGTGLRMHLCSHERNHHSPVDLITDRFQSKLLRYTVFFLQVFPSIMYLTVQVISIRETFDALFGTKNVGAVFIVMGLIVAFEWVGGLTSVAVTDCIQASLMALSSIILPCVIVANFGGWNDIDVDTYPKPEFYSTPSTEEQWRYWQLSMINFSFFTLPHLIQRNYAARDLTALRAGYLAMAFGPWLMMFVGVFVGTVGVEIVLGGTEDGEQLEDPDSPLYAILEEVMNASPFAKLAGSITMSATLAAIMSTADSLLIAISHLVINEVVHPLLAENATAGRIKLYARLVSLTAACLAIWIGTSENAIGNLAKVQFDVSVQSVPAFLVALFATNRMTDIHPWCLTAGALTGTIYVFAFFFAYIEKNDDALPMNSGISGLIVNVVVTLSLELVRRSMPPSDKESTTEGGKLAEEGDTVEGGDIVEEEQLLFPDRPLWDVPKLSRFGEGVLSPEKIWILMDRVSEPMTNIHWVGLIAVLVTFVTPWTPENIPPLVESADGSTFLYPVALVHGLPWWFFKLLLIVLIPYLLLFISIIRMPVHSPAAATGSEFAL